MIESNGISSSSHSRGLLRSLSARVVVNTVGGSGKPSAASGVVSTIDQASCGGFSRQENTFRNDHYNSNHNQNSFQRNGASVPTCIDCRYKFNENNQTNIETKSKRSRSMKALPSTSFLVLLQSRNYRQIIDTLRNSAIFVDDLLGWLMSDIQPSFSAVTVVGPLHIALQDQPDFELVDAIATKLKEISSKAIRYNVTNGINRDNIELKTVVCDSPEDAIDSFGQVPLHIASGNGCDIRVIHRLLRGSSKIDTPAMVRDHHWRYPLHTACCNVKGVKNFTLMNNSKIIGTKNNTAGNTSTPKKWVSFFSTPSSSKKRGLENMVKIIDALINAYPDAVMCRDKDGNRPIDLARKNKADVSIVNLLLKQARKCRSNSTTHQVQHQKPPPQLMLIPDSCMQDNNFVDMDPGGCSSCGIEYEHRREAKSIRTTVGGSYDIFSPDYNSFHSSLGRSWHNLEDIPRFYSVPDYIIVHQNKTLDGDNDSISTLGSKKDEFFPMVIGKGCSMSICASSYTSKTASLCSSQNSDHQKIGEIKIQKHNNDAANRQITNINPQLHQQTKQPKNGQKRQILVRY